MMQFILVMIMYVSGKWYAQTDKLLYLQGLDYLSAKKAGMRSLLLVREGISKEDIPKDTLVIESLTQVSDVVGL